MGLIKRTFTLIKHFHPWVSLIIFVAAYVLYYMGKIIKTSEALMACGIVVIVSILESLVNIRTSIDDISMKQEHDNQTLRSLQDCLSDLHAHITNVKRSSKVVIEHLGLNMTDAWQELGRVINACPAGEIDCRVLIMTDNPSELGPDAPEDVKVWCRAVGGAIDGIKTGTESLGQILRSKGTSFKFTLRQYTGTPIIHGFTVLEPFERGYISFASWGLSAFEWGGQDYFTFPNSTVSSTDRRLRELLGGAFQHYWNHKSKEIYNHSNTLN
jgi:hypothetical protein